MARTTGILRRFATLNKCVTRFNKNYLFNINCNEIFITTVLALIDY